MGKQTLHATGSWKRKGVGEAGVELKGGLEGESQEWVLVALPASLSG